ncbi:hypothetical protein JST56_03100 [Candidatus Dependentiae bacterium]|nr:hypothetical protein [Candidatus Dependentiae bacterium]
MKKYIRSGCMLLVLLISKNYHPLFSYSNIPDIPIIDDHIIDARVIDVEQDYIGQAEQFIDDCVDLGLHAKTAAQVQEIEELADVGLRSIIGQAVDSESKPIGVKFNKTAFSNNNLYLGADEMPPDETYALARATVQAVRGTDGKLVNHVEVVALAQDEGTKVNGVEEAHPLKGQIIDHLTLMGKRYPVATIAVSDGSTLNKVVLVTDEVTGKNVLTNKTHELKDAADTLLEDKQIVGALAASSDTIFLAIPPSAADFGADNSGFVRLKKATDQANGLEMQKRDGTIGQDFTYKLNLDAHTLGQTYPISPLKNTEQVQISFTPDPMKCQFITGAAVGPDVDMYWDSSLNRLYIGLGEVAGDMEKKGGVLCVLVGRIDPKTNTMIINPIIPFDTAPQLLPLNDLTRIVGFQSDKASKIQASAFKIRTMNTSTGKNYLIVNGGVDTLANAARLNPLVSALPLVPTKKTPTKDNDAQDIGLLANKNNRSLVAKNAAQLLTKNDLETQVGMSPAYLGHNLTAFEKDKPPAPPVCNRGFLNQPQIIDMNVVGDTVYVSLAGQRDGMSREEQGIFASTAIFDEQGTVRAWTPWERQMGRIEPVYGFGVDTASQNIFYLDDSKESIKATQWGRGDFTISASGGIHNASPLATVLDGFTQSLTMSATFGPVYNIVNFDDETPGFKAYAKEKEFAPFSMMVATGNQKVALVQTGVRDGTNVFQQTEQFIAGDTKTLTNNNVFIFNDEALKGAKKTGNAAKDAKLPQGIGQIVTAEVSRIPLSDKAFTSECNGWIFVGGTQGIAVLKDSFGAGWETNKGKGLDQLRTGNQVFTNIFPGKGYSFLQLKDSSNTNLFNDTRSLLSDGKYLYIVTSNKVFRYEINAADFVTGKIAQERLKEIINRDLSLDENGNKFLTNAQLSNLLVVDKTTNARRFLLATSKGLWLSNNALTDNGDVMLESSTGSALENLAWTNKIGNAAGTGSSLDIPFPLGQVTDVQLIAARRGSHFNGDILDTNLQVRAADEANKNLSVYRFNVQKQDDPQKQGSSKVFVKAFKEPYFTDTVLDYNKVVQETKRTKEFYKIGTLDAGVATGLDDPLNVPSGFNVQAIPLRPNPSYFLQANQDKSAIDLNQKIRFNDRFAKFVRDTTSGAVYVPGLFGVAVNE